MRLAILIYVLFGSNGGATEVQRRCIVGATEVLYGRSVYNPSCGWEPLVDVAVLSGYGYDRYLLTGEGRGGIWSPAEQQAEAVGKPSAC